MPGMPTPERQQELDQKCNKQCSDSSIASPCLARFSGADYNHEMKCFTVEQLLSDSQWCSSSDPIVESLDLKDVLFRRPLYGNSEIQMWLDHMCNDPLINNIQNLQPSLINFIARFDNHRLKCESGFSRGTATRQQEADEEKLKSLIQGKVCVD